MFTVERRSDGVIFRKDDRLLRVRFMTDSIVRITYTQGREFLDRPSRIVVAMPDDVAFELRHEQQNYVLSTAGGERQGELEVHRGVGVFRCDWRIAGARARGRRALADAEASHA